MHVVPRTSLAQLPTHDVCVLEWGAPDGRLVIALHGFPDTAWTWRTLAPLLADAGYRVIAPFMRGYAPSGIPSDGDYSVRALARDALALYERFGDGEAILLGHDWGAIAADALAGDPDSPFSSVIALAVPPLPWISPTRATLLPWVGAIAKQPFHSWYMAYNQVPGLAERTFERLAAKLWQDWSPGYDATEDLGFLRESTLTQEHRRAVVSYYRALLSKGTRSAFVEPVHPVLSLQGDQDGAFDPGFYPAVRAHANAASRTELIEGTGHFLHLEKPEIIAERILAFLS